ncbi:GL21253 [Drosophila persimilis]|uniref:Cell death abnormality protein 1 n=2 Tax=pseudoobscura subgroup TaxID=32358 RepID=Q29K95_DROPS|nr:cell death abnormality protein 1 [Drosophila pseudoobscura]XP_002023244.1 cell death abnormality protein 1 [Drosophila persimilis]EDW27372.1 GL21253 [Drosophila persimilis]
MWLHETSQHLGLLLLCLVLGLPPTQTNVPNYSEYDGPNRYDPRRPQSQDPSQFGRRYSSNRQQSPSQPLFNRPGGANYEVLRPLEQQPKRREYLVRSHETLFDREQHKCRIWVPPETAPKYPHANTIQSDLANKLSLIEVCCTGYSASRLLGVTQCRPLCGCQNGSCRAPGECDCYEGFVKNDNGDCVFACPLGCQNGRCFLDGSCLCDPGYKLDETRRFCRPICSSGCGNSQRHNCTEPEVCGCSKGYQLTDDGCQPVCEPDCGIGGLCRDNNECECGPGYMLKDGVCQTDCYQKCSNGVCVSRNRCICDPGFSYHEPSTMCIPV